MSDMQGTNGGEARCSLICTGEVHIFADRPGHLPDTPRNRQIIVELINDQRNRIGVDGNDKTWYAKTQPDGSQLWASVFRGVLSDAGKNEAPREWNNETGFNRNPFRRKRGK